MAYSGERAMFEAYGRNKYTSTGVIQWMLNNAWPSMIWHLYDYYLDAGGGFYGAKKACEPLHIQYSYDDRGVYVVNSGYHAADTLEATVNLYDSRMKQLFSQKSPVAAPSDSSVKVLTIPDSSFSPDSPLYFVELSLKGGPGETVSPNFYWNPARLTQFDWSKTDYTHTPAISHEDLTALRKLPRARVESAMQIDRDENWLVSLRNPSDALAFQIAVAAVDAAGSDISPMPWSDNYFELLPGEARSVSAKPPSAGAEPRVVISGWNIPSTTLTFAHSAAASSQSAK